MKRYLGFNLGQYGDLVMSTVAARSLKELDPGCHLTYHIAKKYEAISKLFLYNEYIDEIHISEGYADYPTENDKKFLENAKFDFIFNPMPQHSRGDWYKHCRTQPEEVCWMHGLKPSENLQCYLNKWFHVEKQKGHIAVALFGNYGQSKKAFSKDQAQNLVDHLISLGYKVHSIASPLDPKIDGAIYENLTYIGSVKRMLSCEFLLACDTGMNWVASAYSHPVIGIYAKDALYPNQENFGAIQPINPNAQYLNLNSIKDLDVTKLSEYIRNI